jgi:hypothetical protein
VEFVESQGDFVTVKTRSMITIANGYHFDQARGLRIGPGSVDIASFIPYESTGAQ